MWLTGEDIKLKLSSEKLGNRQLGPYKILEKTGLLDYCLDLSDTLSGLHPVFHVDKLYPYRGTEVNGLLPEAPGPVELEDEDEPEWEVHSIIDSRIRWKRLEYKVKWKGYSARDDTWEPVENLKNAKRSITAFHKKHPNAIKL